MCLQQAPVEGFPERHRGHPPFLRLEKVIDQCTVENSEHRVVPPIPPRSSRILVAPLSNIVGQLLKKGT